MPLVHCRGSARRRARAGGALGYSSYSKHFVTAITAHYSMLQLHTRMVWSPCWLQHYSRYSVTAVTAVTAAVPGLSVCPAARRANLYTGNDTGDTMDEWFTARGMPHLRGPTRTPRHFAAPACTARQ